MSAAASSVGGESAAWIGELPPRSQLTLDDIIAQFEDRIEEVKKKLLDTTKEKALLKLEKDKLQKKAFTLQASIKTNEEKVQKEIEAQHKRQRASMSPNAAQD